MIFFAKIVGKGILYLQNILNYCITFRFVIFNPALIEFSPLIIFNERPKLYQ